MSAERPDILISFLDFSNLRRQIPSWPTA